MSIQIQKTEDPSTQPLGSSLLAGKERHGILARISAEAKKISSRVRAANLAMIITAAVMMLLMLMKIVFLFGSPEHLPVITHPLQDFAGQVKHVPVPGQAKTFGDMANNFRNMFLKLYHSWIFDVVTVATVLMSSGMAIARQDARPILLGIPMACGMFFMPQVALTVFQPQNSGQEMETKIVGAIYYPASLIQASQIALIGEKTRLTPSQTRTFDQDIHQALQVHPARDWKIKEPSYAYRLVKSARLPVADPVLKQYQIQREKGRASYTRWNDGIMDALYGVSLLLALLFVARHVIGSNSAVVMDFLLQSESGPDGYVRAND